MLFYVYFYYYRGYVQIRLLSTTKNMMLINFVVYIYYFIYNVIWDVYVWYMYLHIYKKCIWYISNNSMFSILCSVILSAQASFRFVFDWIWAIKNSIYTRWVSKEYRDFPIFQCYLVVKKMIWTQHYNTINAISIVLYILHTT